MPWVSIRGKTTSRSQASNLVTGDNNGTAWDIFTRDLQTGAIDRVAVSSAGVQANGASQNPLIRADGCYVAYRSSATNLMAGATNGQPYVLVRDRTASTTTRVSVASGGNQVTGSASDEPAISNDGRFVAFQSDATNLVAGDTKALTDIFRHDRQPTTTLRVSLSTTGVQGNDTSRNTSASADGQTVAFESDSTNLIANDTNASQDVFVRGPGVDAASYGYDRLYRLTSVSAPDGARSYAYDPVGNRTTKVLAGSSTAYTYDRADRISAAGATSITVDAVGNLTARGTDTFTYDQAKRLTSATVAGVTESSTYDGDGVRFSRQVGTDPVIRYVSDINTGLPVTLDDGTRKYVWGLGLAYAVAGSAVEVQHADRLGSIRALTDATGAVTATYRTDEFGVQTSSTGPSGQPFGFTGEPLDASGLSYLRARHYDPALGRFLSRDPFPGFATDPLSLHRYAYVTNNPATHTDPSGRCVWPILATAPGGITVVIGVGVSVTCLLVVAAVGTGGLAASVIDPKKGDAYPPDINYPRQGQPTREVPLPAPAPSLPDPERDPHENPPNPAGGSDWIAIIAAVGASLVGNLLFGVDGNGEPVRNSKSQVLREPGPIPPPDARPN